MFKLIGPALIIIFSIACSPQESALKQYEIQFIGKTNNGEPLPNMIIVADGKELGKTDNTGQLATSLAGIDGQRIDLNASCPDGFRGPTEQPELVLRTFESVDPTSSNHTTLEIVCTASERYAVIAVKTQIPDIPVLFQGESIARTAETGVTHAMLKLPIDSNIRLELDTRRRPDLRPQNPSRIFSIEKEDTFMVWNQELKAQPKKKIKIKRVQPKEQEVEVRQAPYRLE